MGRALKQAFVGTVLSVGLAGLMGCTSLAPKFEPTPLPTKHRRVIHATPPTKVVKPKKMIVKKEIKPAEETSQTLPAIPAMGGGGTGGGSNSGGGGSSSGGGGGNWGGG